MRIVKILAGILVVVAVVIGLRSIMLKKIESDKKEKTPTIYPIIVKAVKTKTPALTTFDYVADVRSNSNAVINSKFAGKITYIKNLGESVKKGEIVLKIDDTELKNTLNDINKKLISLNQIFLNQKSILSNLNATLKRTKKLLKVKIASIEEVKNIENKILELKSQIENTKSQITSLKINKKTILNNLKYTEITSPIDGIVSAKLLNSGDTIFPGKVALKISSNKDNYLVLPLAREYKKVIVNNKEYRLIPLNETLNSIPLYKIDVNVKKPIGSKVKVAVITYEGNNTLVPYDAILSVDGQNYVFDKNLKIHKVKIIASGKEGVVINKNLDKVIVAGADLLLRIKSGYPAKIKE